MGRTRTGERTRKLSHVCTGCGYGYTDADWQGYRCQTCSRINFRLYREEHLNPGQAMFMSDAEITAELAASDVPALPFLTRGELNAFRDVPRKAG